MVENDNYHETFEHGYHDEVWSNTLCERQWTAEEIVPKTLPNSVMRPADWNYVTCMFFGGQKNKVDENILVWSDRPIRTHYFSAYCGLFYNIYSKTYHFYIWDEYPLDKVTHRQLLLRSETKELQNYLDCPSVKLFANPIQMYENLMKDEKFKLKEILKKLECFCTDLLSLILDYSYVGHLFLY